MLFLRLSFSRGASQAPLRPHPGPGRDFVPVDKLLERGIAVLALEGPGQGECCVREIHPTATNWMQAGPLVLSWLRSQSEVDPDRIALSGVSMGSFWGTQ